MFFGVAWWWFGVAGILGGGAGQWWWFRQQLGQPLASDPRRIHALEYELGLRKDPPDRLVFGPGALIPVSGKPGEIIAPLQAVRLRSFAYEEEQRIACDMAAITGAETIIG